MQKYMPCKTCGHSLLVYDNEYICPKCKQLALLDSITAITVSRKIVDHLSTVFDDELTKYNTQILLGNLAAHREYYSRQYFLEYRTLDLGKLFAYTFLLKRACRFRNTAGKIPTTKEDISTLVDTVEKLIDMEVEHLKLKSGYNTMLYLEKFDENKLRVDQLLNNFRIVENEKYLIVRKTFANHDIFTDKEAEGRLEQYKNEGHSNIGDQQQSKTFTPEQFVSTNYGILNSMYVGLLRNQVHSETFDLRSYAEIFDDPGRLMEFVNTFRFEGGNTHTTSPTEVFILRAQTFFKISREKVNKILLFDEDNSSIFPLFVRFKSQTLGDVVIISHRFSYFIYTILHAILRRDLFGAETEKRSKTFEKERVKNEFERLDYTYLTNVVDKRKSTLEIDGIALKNDRCYVVECKGWRLPHLVDELDKKNQTIRDLIGIIKGEKYSISRNGRMTMKKVRSLLDKMQFVNDNLSLRDLKRSQIKTVDGLIVLIDYSPIPEYEGIKIISVDQISGLGP
jgi:hypothetical protein